MRFDLGLILGVICEFIFMVYYANSTFYSKKDTFYTIALSIMGYSLIFAVASLGYIIISIIAFFIVNLLLFMICYKIDLKNAIFQTIILDSLSVITEFAVSWLLEIKISLEDAVVISNFQSIILTVSSKILYLIGLLILKRFIKTGKNGESGRTLGLIIIPVLTLACVLQLASAQMKYHIFLSINLMLLIINIIVFIIHEMINAEHKALLLVREENSKNKYELESYRIMEDKYEQTRILRHDFKEQIRALQSLITEDNVKAREFADNLTAAEKQLEFNSYTDNNILNVLLASKIKECQDSGIEMHIQSLSPPLNFISDIDTVAIFSNLINNAIEACRSSAKKTIFIDFNTVNNSFTAIKIENSCGENPILYNGKLYTRKTDAEHHGIGMKSVQKTLAVYKGTLDWSYDSGNKIFRTVVLIPQPQKPTNNYRSKPAPQIVQTA